jgi:hypothetical protein
MKTRSLSLLAVCVAASLVVLLAGCPFPKTSVKSASLTVSIKNNINARTLLPPISMDAASYTVDGAGPNGATFSRSTSGDPVTVEELPFGTWTVTVNALNASDTVIGQGQAVATVSMGKNTTLAITVTPLGGTGGLNLSVTWTASLQNPSIQASLMPLSGSATSLDFAVSGKQASYSSSTIPAGYYTLTLQLMENNFPVMGAVEVVRIVSGQITSGTYDFSNVNRGTLVVNITPALANPIPVSISGVSSSVAVGTSVTATASVSDGTANVLYVWYLNGVSQATGPSYSFGSNLNTGYYRLDVTAFTTDGMRAGSATASFQVIKTPTNVAGYWDITITLEGQQPMAPELLYIQQTGTSLDAGMSPFFLSGSIDGPNVTLAGSVQGTTVTFKGTVSGGEITGTVSAPGIGQGTFHMVPATLHFGHLDMQGSYKDVPLSVNTEYALGEEPLKEYDFGFDLNLGRLGFETRSELSVNKTFTVSTDEDQPDSMRVSVWQNDSSIDATGGVVGITRYDSAGVAGSFNLSFSDGSSLTGTFDLVPGASSTASVQGSGMWSAVQAAVPTYSYVGTTSGFTVSFLDNQLKMELKFRKAGDLGLGDYTMPTAAWLDVQWRPKGGGPDELPPTDLPGTLHITSFSATGIAGSFNTGFSAGGTIAGNFDVSF